MYNFIVSSQSPIHLQVTIPPDGQACPGKTLVLTCSINSSKSSQPPTMFWEQMGLVIYYYNGAPLSATFGDFHSTANFSNNNYNIVSNVTLRVVTFSHNGIRVSCYSPSSMMNKRIRIAGMQLLT